MITNFGSTHKNTKNVAIKKKNIQVTVRARPLSENERAMKNKNIVFCDNVSKVITLKSTNLSDRYAQGQRTFGPFDKIFGPEATQIEIYKDIVSPLMREVINGYNCTVFAYGQTGSGKTYTMEGRHDDTGEYSWESDPTSGIIPRALHQIFTELGSDEIDFTVRVSYVELYNENIYDLLSMSENSQFESLRIFDDKAKGVSIAGAEEVIVRNRNEVYELLKRGAEKRRTAATLMNISSSRSHSVFTVSVMIRESGLVNGEELLRQGKLNLVDLAGSENIGRSGATDKRAREAGNINASLLALGRVINALTMNAPHIPYRESKLTRILQDSLGGKTITTIIATISPASSNFEESVNTLEYAQRAKNIKNNPEINQKITRRGLLKEYNDEIERLRRDLLAAREKHGIYLDKENYDNMVGTIEEKSSKLEELEGQLEGQMQRLNTLLEDFKIMDSHYQSVYEKCRTVMDKLENRKVEVQKLNKDLAQSHDNLKAANKALNLSENTFVRLRSQAYKIQTNCTNFYQELSILHDKLNTRKQIDSDNAKMLENFAMEHTARLNLTKDHILDHSNASILLMDGGQNLLKEQASGSAQYSTKNLELFTDMKTKISGMLKSYSDMLNETMCDFERRVQDHNANFDTSMQKNTQSIQTILNDQKTSSSTVASQLSSNLEESIKEIEHFTQNEFQRVPTTGTTPDRRQTNSFMEVLVDMPPAQKIFDEQRMMITPRRTSNYRARDSLLDSSDYGSGLISPNTLRSNLPGQMMDLKLEPVSEEKGTGSMMSGSGSARTSDYKQ